MKAPIYTLQGEEKGSIELQDAIFNSKWNADLVHQAFVAQQANLRRPWAHSRTRGEVSGGGKKPWRQKGTGRARHGSIRSPLWKGGGATHGPRNDRDYSQKINRRMKRAALFSALSKKLADGEVKFIDSMEFKNQKTKEVASAFKAFFKAKIVPSTLVIAAGENKTIIRAARNLPKVKTLRSNSLNIGDLLTYKNVLIEKAAAPEIK